MAKKDAPKDVRAKEFMTKSKSLFKKIFHRDRIDEIGVTECTEKNGAFGLSGPVCTTSPTGKQKTFRYNASVKVDDEGTCSLSGISVSEI